MLAGWHRQRPGKAGSAAVGWVNRRFTATQDC